jgi:hypothetical protein
MSLQITEQWNEHSIPIVLQQFFASSKSDPSAGYSNIVPDVYKENSTEIPLLGWLPRLLQRLISHILHVVCLAIKNWCKSMGVL